MASTLELITAITDQLSSDPLFKAAAELVLSPQARQLVADFAGQIAALEQAAASAAEADKAAAVAAATAPPVPEDTAQ